MNGMLCRIKTRIPFTKGITKCGRLDMNSDKVRRRETAQYGGLLFLSFYKFFSYGRDISSAKTSNRCSTNKKPAGGREM